MRRASTIPEEPLGATLQDISDTLENIPPVRWLARQLQVQPLFVGVVGLLWVVGFFLWGFTGEIIGAVAGYAYPLFASFKALEDNQLEEVSDWLVYWVSFAVFSLMENLLYRMLSIIPLYHIARLIFIVWLFLPGVFGAQYIFAWLVAPLLRRYRSNIDLALQCADKELRTGFCGEIREKLLEANKEQADTIKDLGIDDLVRKELTRAAAKQVGKAIIGDPYVATPSRAGARKREASPRPMFTPRHEEQDF